MRWPAGPTGEQLWRAQRARLEAWHPWWAWHPVRIDTEWVWLERVQRIGFYSIGYGGDWTWDYKLED